VSDEAQAEARLDLKEERLRDRVDDANQLALFLDLLAAVGSLVLHAKPKEAPAHRLVKHRPRAFAGGRGAVARYGRPRRSAAAEGGVLKLLSTWQ